MNSSSMIVGDIFTNKQPIGEGGGVKVSNPKPGDTGWRFEGNNDKGKPVFEEVVFDKGGTERKHRDQGGAIFSQPAEWVSLVEHKRRKEGRSRYWQKAKGPAEYARRHKRFNLRERWGGMYGGDHPHAFA